MKNLTFKFTAIFLILFVFLFHSCSDDFNVDVLYPDAEGNFLYIKEKMYCSRTPDEEFKSISFKYDENNNVVEEITYFNNRPDKKISSTFANNLRQLDSTFYFRDNQWEWVHGYEYKYTKDKLAEKRRLKANGNNSHKVLYSYNNSKLEWEEFYYFNNNAWEYQYGHKYKYYKRDQVVKRESYTSEAKDKVYDTFVYTYNNGKIREEKRIIQTGETSYIKKYYYTRNNLLDYIEKDENIIQQNFYEVGKLVEKHTFYFGIDPCFSPCCGSSVYKYQY